jgi:very-short-patch-repair endonuclease
MDNSDNSIELNKKYNHEFYPEWKTADPYFYSVLKDKRKQMRDNMTNAESVLWEYIKSKKLGVKFRRQHIIGNFIPDFVCLTCKLIIEVDGEIHNFQKEYDNGRTFLLKEEGFRIIRFKNEEVLQNIELVVEKIKENIELKS